MIISKEIDENTPLTTEEIAMLEALRMREPAPDEDCPELTDSELRQMIENRRKRKERREKEKKDCNTR